MLKYILEWCFFYLIKFLNYVNVFSVYRLKLIFSSFWKGMIYYPFILLFCYIFLSYGDYVIMQNWEDEDELLGVNLWASSWHKSLWNEKTFLFLLGLCISINIFFFWSFFFPETYKDLKKEKLVFVSWFGYYVLDENIVFWDLFFYFGEKNNIFLIVLYWIIFWSCLFVQWAVDLEEDVDFREEKEDRERKRSNLEPLDRIPDEYKNRSLRWYISQLFTGSFGESYEEPEDVVKRYQIYKKRVEELKARDANQPIEEFKQELPDLELKAYRDIMRALWNLEDFFAFVKTVFQELYNLSQHWSGISVSFSFRYWYRLLIARFFDYLRFFFRTLVFLMSILVKRKPKVYPVGPYEYYDPFYNKNNFKRMYLNKEKKSIKINKVPKEIGTSSWNLSQKKLSLFLFQNKK